MESPDRSPRYSRYYSERSRSRSRSGSVSRHCDRSFSRSRTPIGISGEADIASLLNKQQEKVYDIISSQKEEIDELKQESNLSFKNKAIEKQYRYNQKIIKDLKKLKKHFKKGKTSSCADIVKKLLQTCEEHKEDLLIADSSKYGWLTVHQLRGQSSLPSDLLKKVEKIDNKLDKEKAKPGYNGRKDQKRGKTDTEPLEREAKQFARRKAGPEETLQQLTKSKRYGTCSHCQEEGHFFRECSKFWLEVSEQRKKNSSN